MAVLAVAGCALGAAVLAVTLPAAAGRRGGGRAMALREVLLVLWRSAPLRRTTVGTCLTEGGAGALPVVCALLAVHLGHSSRDVGVLVTAYGVGALAGSVAVTLLPRAHAAPARRIPVYAAVIAAAFAAAAYAPDFAAAAACFAVAGLADGPMLAATLAVRSRYAPEDARARIFVTGAGLKIAAASLGAAFAGVAAGLGARTLLLLCAAVVATGAASMLGAFRRA
jgi:predicted MFS family arabinose efflux permease